MTISIKQAALVAAATVTFMAAPAIAQNSADSTYNDGMVTEGNAVDSYATPTVEQDDDDFPWGLLGLLGLAGLLGLKKKEDDIHVDARRDKTRP